MKFIVLMVTLAVLDVITTRVGIAYGAYEFNPVMQSLIMSWWGIGLKLFLTAVMCWSVMYKRRLFKLMHMYLTINDPAISITWLREYLTKKTRRAAIYIRLTCILLIVMMVGVVLWNSRTILLVILPDSFFEWLGQYV